jgi:murein DD-endopeptidase MepM/ murein hydrolase activator NlpD
LLTTGVTGGVPAGSSAVDEARARATEASSAYVAARERLEGIRVEIDRVAADLARTEVEYAEVSKAMADLAVERYVRSGDELELFAGQEVNEQQVAEAFSRLVNQRRTDEVDRYRAVRQDLQRQRERLRALREEAESAAEHAAAYQAQLEEELATVEEAERERLAEEARQREAELAAAKAAGVAAPVAGVGGADTASGGGGGPVAVDDGDDVQVDVRGDAIGWLCPVGGATVFSDTWGDARSNGRNHKGVDMWAEYGTPVVAVVSGSVEENSGGAGGIGQYLTGDDGTSYYYAHLAWVEGSGRVSAGQVIGAVGNTGNALGGPPHLHFEIHPGGWGTAINPYPTVIAAC